MIYLTCFHDLTFLILEIKFSLFSIFWTKYIWVFATLLSNAICSILISGIDSYTSLKPGITVGSFYSKRARIVLKSSISFLMESQVGRGFGAATGSTDFCSSICAGGFGIGASTGLISSDSIFFRGSDWISIIFSGTSTFFSTTIWVSTFYSTI